MSRDELKLHYSDEETHCEDVVSICMTQKLRCALTYSGIISSGYGEKGKNPLSVLEITHHATSHRLTSSYWSCIVGIAVAFRFPA